MLKKSGRGEGVSGMGNMSELMDPSEQRLFEEFTEVIKTIERSTYDHHVKPLVTDLINRINLISGNASRSENLLTSLLNVDEKIRVEMFNLASRVNTLATIIPQINGMAAIIAQTNNLVIKLKKRQNIIIVLLLLNLALLGWL